MNVNKIFDRAKEILNLKSDTSLASTLNMTPSSLSERRRRGTIPWKELFAMCEKERINFHWLLTGNGEQYLLGRENASDPENAALWQMIGFLRETWAKSDSREKIWLEVQFEKCFGDYVSWLKKHRSCNQQDKTSQVA